MFSSHFSCTLQGCLRIAFERLSALLIKRNQVSLESDSTIQANEDISYQSIQHKLVQTMYGCRFLKNHYSNNFLKFIFRDTGHKNILFAKSFLGSLITFYCKTYCMFRLGYLVSRSMLRLN
jgi:hypothetical protein